MLVIIGHLVPTHKDKPICTKYGKDNVGHTAQ